MNTTPLPTPLSAQALAMHDMDHALVINDTGIQSAIRRESIQMCERKLLFYIDETAATKDIDELMASTAVDLTKIDSYSCPKRLMKSIENTYCPQARSGPMPMKRFYSMDATESTFPTVEKHEMASMGVSVGSYKAYDIRAHAASEVARMGWNTRNGQESFRTESATRGSSLATIDKGSHADSKTTSVQPEPPQDQEQGPSQPAMRLPDVHLEVDDAAAGAPERPSVRLTRKVDPPGHLRAAQAPCARRREDKSSH